MRYLEINRNFMVQFHVRHPTFMSISACAYVAAGDEYGRC